jgi:hypothetical protein
MQQQAISDLVMIAFYYLLRVDKYTTKGKRTKQTRTQQFWVMDVTFFQRSKSSLLLAMPSNEPPKDVLGVSAATLHISN